MLDVIIRNWLSKLKGTYMLKCFSSFKKPCWWGLPWWSSGQDSVFTMQGPGTKESSLAREINRPHMLQLRVHMRQPKIPHAKTKAPGSQKKNRFQRQGLGKRWQAPRQTPKVARSSPWCSPRSKPRRWDEEDKAFKHKPEEELKAKAKRPPAHRRN